MSSTFRDNYNTDQLISKNRKVLSLCFEENIPFEYGEILGVDHIDEIDESIIERFIELQKELGVSADGIIGRNTLNKIYDVHLSHDCQHVIYNGVKFPIHQDMLSYKIITFDDVDGLDLHKYGNFSPKKNTDIDKIILHWGGLNPRHCFNVFKNRKASSHFLIGYDEKDMLPVIFQVIDLKHKTWHGGKANTNSVGIDICQQPTLRWKDRYIGQGYNIKQIENPTKIGERNIVSLDPKIVEMVHDLVFVLAELFDVPLETSRDENGKVSHQVLSSVKAGVYGHHHVDFKRVGKWDIACWWQVIFSDTSLGDIDLV